MASPWPVVVARLQRASATGWPRGRHANTSPKNTMSRNGSAATPSGSATTSAATNTSTPAAHRASTRVSAFEAAEQHDQQDEQERQHNGPQVAVEVARPQVPGHGRGHAGHCHRGCHHRRAPYTLPQDQPRQAGSQERHGGRDHGDVGHLDPLQRVDVEDHRHRGRHEQQQALRAEGRTDPQTGRRAADSAPHPHLDQRAGSADQAPPAGDLPGAGVDAAGDGTGGAEPEPGHEHRRPAEPPGPRCGQSAVWSPRRWLTQGCQPAGTCSLPSAVSAATAAPQVACTSPERCLRAWLWGRV